MVPRPAEAGRVAVHQPNLFPRLKVLQKLAKSGIWVVYDDVQYVRNEWQNRTRIRSLRLPADSFWLTIPVHLPGGRSTNISEVILCDPARVGRQVRASIRHAYRRSVHWRWIATYLDQLPSVVPPDLATYCTESTIVCLRALGLCPRIVYSSCLDLEGSRSARLAAICAAVGGSSYLAGTGGRSYMDLDAFRTREINVEWQHWAPPPTGDTLNWRDVTWLDLLARAGPAALTDHLLAPESVTPDGI